MIRAYLLREKRVSDGGRELLEQWRREPESQLWVDIEGELTAESRQLLHSFPMKSDFATLPHNAKHFETGTLQDK